MARHRAVRSMNIDDELDEDDDYHYGHSLEENYCISPATAAQFTFNRDAHTMASYMAEPDIPEVENEVEEDENPLESSTGNLRKQLNDIDIARLNSCLEEIHNILGETASEQMITEVVLRKKFDVESSLNELLSQQAQEAPKPQRAPRQKRNRSQGDSDSDSDINISPEITEISQNDKSKQKIPFFRTHSSEKIVSHTCNGFIAKCDPGLLDSLAKQKNQVNDKNHLKTVSLSELVEKNKQINSFFNQKNLSKVASETTVPLSKLADQNRQSIKTGDATKLSVNLKPQTCGQTKFGHKDSESICLSLSELANRHNAQSAAFSRTSLIVEASKVRQFAAASSNEITKSDGPSCRIGESKNVLTRNNFDKKEKNSPSLADLAKLNLSSVNFNNGNIKSAKYSLADLAKRHKSVANVADTVTPKPKVELSTLLLLDLAKTHKRKEVLSEPLNTAQKKSVSDKKSKLSTENKSKLKSVEQPLPCNHSIITFHRVMACKSLSDLNNQNPSMFGKALSLRYFKSDKRNSCSRFLKYSFKSQTHGQTDPLVSALQHVTAFDFSTPSPDDIILLRQKEAYKRNGNEI